MSVAHNTERGDAKVAVIIILAVFFMAAGSAAIYFYFQYQKAHTNLEGQISEAVAAAVRDNSSKKDAEFLAREKEPMRTFNGAENYGSLTFDYPKTWSAYISNDVSRGGGATYAAYLNPITVPPLAKNAENDLVANKEAKPTDGFVPKYAVRLKIEQKMYDVALKDYDPLLKTGQITSSAFTNPNGVVGTRFDGRFNNDIRGSAVVIQMRDRTLTMRTDADVNKADFDKLIQTIKFNQ